MESLLDDVAHCVTRAIQTIAVLVVTLGTAMAVLDMPRLAVGRDVDAVQPRQIWLCLPHALVAGLTFQLAADIVSTSIAPTWDVSPRSRRSARSKAVSSTVKSRTSNDCSPKCSDRQAASRSFRKAIGATR